MGGADDVPGLQDFGMASLAVGALFLVRYGLAMRRLWAVAGRPTRFGVGDLIRAPRTDAYGGENEPNRRYAARQLYLGRFFLLAGVLILAWHRIGAVFLLGIF